MTTNAILEVNRAAPGETRLVTPDLAPLGDVAVRLRIDRLAITANNITYASIGDMLGYWDFFPTGDPGWGRVPAMGWAEVAESAHPGVEVGSRYYGWFPMAQYLDLEVTVSADGIRDDGTHRAAHASVYRSYVDTRRDPMYDAGEDAEDRHALLRGLFLTGFLADEFFADSDYFGAASAVVLSASSKTAIGFAQRASQRGLGAVIGVTAPGNAAFVRSLGWYDDVLTYDALDALPGEGGAVVIDMSGNSAALAVIHDYFGDRLAHSMIVGKSHHDAAPVPVTAGPTPSLFFAPNEVSRRMEQWGRAEYQRRSSATLRDFVRGSERWLTVERSTGSEAAQATYQDVFDGAVPPSIGRVVSLHS